MSNHLHAAALLLLLSGATGAADWTRALATRSHDLAFGLAADGSGRLYAGTIFQARFDASAFGGPGVHVPQGRNDSWVFALDLQGRSRWARPIVGAGVTELRDLASTASGRVVATGYYLDGVQLDAAREASAIGGADVFIAAYEADGGPAWLRSFGGKGADVALALAATREAGIVVAGSFEHAMRVGEAGGAPRVLRSAGRRDAFIARLDDDGEVLDAVAFGGPGDDRAIALAASPDGGFAALVLHGPGLDLDGRKLESRGGDEALVLRFDRTGRRVATASLGHEGPDTFESIAVAGDGAVWVGGQFVGRRGLDVAGQRHELRSAGSSDIVVVRFAPSLESASVHSFGNAAADTLARIVPAADGDAFVAGAGSGVIALGKRRYDAPGPRAWVARLGVDGAVRASTLLAAEGISQVTALAPLGGDRVAVLGLYEKSLEVPAARPVKALGKTDPFVAIRTLPR